MNPYGSSRDTYRPSDPRPRSRSPPPRISRSARDYDAPPLVLPKKTVTSSNSIPVNSHASHTNSFASSSSSSTHQTRFLLPDHPDSSNATARPNSVSLDIPADIYSRLLASQPERNLFDDIELKRYSIFEDRRDLGEQHKRLKSLQDYLNKATNKDAKAIAKLTEHQQTVYRLEHKIKIDTDDLFRLQLRWQLELTHHIFAATTAHLDAKVDALGNDLKATRDDLRKGIKDNREEERRRYEDLDRSARMNSGQVNRMQSDIVKIKSELSALTKDAERLRKGVNQDVVQISNNNKRMSSLEKDVATLQTKVVESLPRTADGSSIAAVAVPIPATSTRPSSSPAEDLARSSATQPMLDPQARPPPRQYTNGASSASAPSKSVTQAQFRRWHREFTQDLELRLDEIKELAVQESNAEHQICMEERLRSLVKRWRQKALDDNADSANQGATVADTAAASLSDAADAAPVTATITANGATPMEVDASVTLDQTPADDAEAARTSIVQAAQSEGILMNSTNSVSPSVPANADCVVVALASPPNSAVQTAPVADSRTANSAAGTTAATKPRIAAMSIEALSGIRSMLREHDGKITTIKQEVEKWGSKQAEMFDKLYGKLEVDFAQRLDHFDQANFATRFDQLVSSQEKSQQLLSVLMDIGLGQRLEFAQAAAKAIEIELTALRDSQVGQADRVKLIDDWRQNFAVCVDKKLEWLQKQFDQLDDQASLQGALLVKLAEHANPRRGAARGGQGSSQPNSPAIRSPLVSQAHAPAQAQPVPMVEHQLHRPQPQQFHPQQLHPQHHHQQHQ